MNRQSKNKLLRNNVGRGQSVHANTKNLKPNRAAFIENNGKLFNCASKSSSSILPTAASTHRTNVPKKETYSENVKTNIKTSSAINLTSCLPNTKYQNRIPQKKVFGLRDILRKDFQDEFYRERIKSVGSKSSSKEKPKTSSSTKVIQTANKEVKKEEPVRYSSSRFNLNAPPSDKNVQDVSRNNKFLEREVLKEYNFNKKKQIVINILKKVRENNIKYYSKLGNKGNANKKNKLVPVTPELMNTWNLQPSDISMLLKVLQYKPSQSNTVPPPIKFSQEPFIKVKKMNKALNKECSDRKGFDLKTRFKMNTNVETETDCFISKVKDHFIDRTLYQKERKPVILAPTLSTITEEPEPEPIC